MSVENMSGGRSCFAREASNLSAIRRTITGNRDDGEAHFEVHDGGDDTIVRRAPGYHCEVVETNIYCTFACPVNLNDNCDLHAALNEWKVSAGHVLISL